MRELLILRHGKAGPHDQEDFGREIVDRGKRASQRMGVWLLGSNLVPDHVISSPAARAIETARKSCKCMGLAAGDIVEDERIYDAGCSSLLQVLAEVPENFHRVMLTGHNPGLKTLVCHLSGERHVVLKTADLAQIGMPDDWSRLDPGCGRLIGIKHARELPKGFPYPAPGSTELRDRPAYYYTQSSVVPYRMNRGVMEILVIRSSKKKHWVVPKGIREPGMSPQESAAREAAEEAGVEGIVATEPLGSYVYTKWGADCTCQVYPMQVTRELSAAEWPERHRGRFWVSPEEAATRLRQPELAPMVRVLAARLGTEESAGGAS
jgi:phosphohistidine phosphatase